jgi:hypothetical protein
VRQILTTGSVGPQIAKVPPSLLVAGVATAPVYVTSGGTTQSQPTTNAEFVLGTVEDDDECFAYFVGNQDVTITTPGGWTELTPASPVTAGTFSDEMRVFKKTLAATDSGATVTFTTSNAFFEFQYIVLRPAAGLNVAVDVYLGAASGADGTAMVTPSVTTTGPDRTLIHFAANQGAGGDSGSITWGAGVTSRYTHTFGATDYYGGGIATEDRPTAGATSTRTCTAGLSGSWNTFQIAVYSA